MKQYEYAAFTVRVHFDPSIRESPYIPPHSWPDQIAQAELLERMNELGAEGWEIFERIHPSVGPAAGEDTYPFNLWARRPKP